MSLQKKIMAGSKSILVSTLILIVNYPLSAQWARVIGSPGDEELFSVCQTSNRDYFAVGYHYQPYADYPLVMKITHDGRIKWKKYYGSFCFARPQAVLPTVDEGCIVAGYKEVFGEDYGEDIWVIKLDKQGNTVWEKCSGKPFNEQCFSMTETSDGGYLLAGNLDSEAFVMKLSSDGEVIWQKSYATQDSSYTRVSSIQQTKDGGIILAGNIQFNSSTNIWICKLGERGGAIVWEYAFDGGHWDRAFSVVETFEGYYTLCGKIDDENLILNLSHDGKTRWQKKYSGHQNILHLIRLTTDGGYIVVGENTSGAKGPKTDVSLIRLSSQGDILWQRVYGGDFSADMGFSVQQTLDGSFILVGTTSSWGAGGKDALILKLWRNGNISPFCSFMRNSKATASDASLKRYVVRTRIKKTNIRLYHINSFKRPAKARIYNLAENSTHKLKIKTSEWGTTDPPPGAYYFANGTEITIRAIPDNDYRFSRWEGHIQAGDENLTLKLDGDKTIQAIFEETDEWSGLGGGGVGNINISENKEAVSVVCIGIGFMLLFLVLFRFLSYRRNKYVKGIR